MLTLRACEAGIEAIGICPTCSTPLAPTALIGWTFRSPADIAGRLTHLGALEREELHVVIANTKNRVIAVERVYQGNVSASLVRVGELFREAVKLNASAIVIAHNHPSGDPTPSPDDLHLTAQAIAAGRLLDIEVLDHLIIARDGAYVSLRDRGVSFDRTTGGQS